MEMVMPFFFVLIMVPDHPPNKNRFHIRIHRVVAMTGGDFAPIYWPFLRYAVLLRKKPQKEFPKQGLKKTCHQHPIMHRVNQF